MHTLSQSFKSSKTNESWFPTYIKRLRNNSQQTRNVAGTSLQHRCNVRTLQRRCNAVVATLCVCWEYSKLPKFQHKIISHNAVATFWIKGIFANFYTKVELCPLSKHAAEPILAAVSAAVDCCLEVGSIDCYIIFMHTSYSYIYISPKV